MRQKWLRSMVLSLALATGAAEATMTPRLTLEGMVERSERIVQGRCLRTWSEWDAGRQFIWTHSEIEVSESLKGGPVTTVTISEPGGRVGDLEMRIEGMPHYQPGEEMVLFVYRTPIGLWRARGLGQGKYRILADPASGRRRVRGDVSGVALAEPARPTAGRGTELRQLDGMQLEDFKSRLRELIGRQAAGVQR